MSKKWKVVALIVAIIVVALILVFTFKPGQDVEPTSDLLGTWTVAGDFLGSGAQASLLVQINEFRPAEDKPNTYLGAGCMQTEASGGWAPLSLQAVFDADTASYALNMLSTLIAPELDGGATVIRFVGDAGMASGGVKNDRASGTAYTSAGEIAWSGGHTSLEPAECPAWDEALTFWSEFGVGRDLAYIPPWDISDFQAETKIASSQMRVETPDGQVFLAGYHTDIFTPEVNFIDVFRFHYAVEGTPITAQPYDFTLLDVLGEPVPGAESQDIYRRCDQGAATNLRAVYTQLETLELTWDAPEIIPDYFDPQNGHGFYQLTLEYNPWRESNFLYGAEVITALHHVPWNPFEPGSTGSPEGADYGISLSELEDGQYILFVAAYSYYEPAAGESGFDCRVIDTRHTLLINKQGDQITAQPAGAVSGFVYDADGNPLEDIAVEINGLSTGFHERVCSQANGYYLFTRLPLDTFTWSAGGFGTEVCAPNNFATIIQPDFALDAEYPIRENMDFILTP
jgi:hypothetical protein